MLDFLINPLSPHGQCPDEASALNLLCEIVRCFDRLQPALVAQRSRLLVDERIEQNFLFGEIPLGSTISRLPSKPVDIRKKWFIYTRNRGRKVTGGDKEVVLRSPDAACETVVTGLLTQEVETHSVGMLSFGGSDLMMSERISIQTLTSTLERENAHDLTSLNRLLPVYESSPKHRKEKYYDAARQELVAAMPLSHDTASEVLLGAVPVGDGYIGYHTVGKKYIRFRRTRDNIFHGYEIEVAEVPNDVAQILLQ